MKKLFYVFLFLCFLSSSAHAQTRHLLKTNIFYNQLPFSAKQKFYLFNQYQLIHQNRWILGLAYGNSQQSGFHPEAEEWLTKFDPGESDADYSFSERYQNAELSLAYNFFSEIPTSTLNLGLGLGTIKNKYNYIDELELLNRSIVYISKNERNTSLVYLAINGEFAEIFKDRFQIGINFQLKISQAINVVDASYFYRTRNFNNFSNIQIEEKFTLGPTFGVSIGYYLNRSQPK